VDVGDGARIATNGEASQIVLRASDRMTISGRLLAGTGTTVLRHRDPALPPAIAPTAQVTPAPMIIADPMLPPCICGGAAANLGISCDDHNPCTQDVCDSLLGCGSSPLVGEGIAGCDNANVCDGRETCTAELRCIRGTPPPLDDGDPCTDDGACDPAAGVPHVVKTGLRAAGCRMDRVEQALAAAAAGDVAERARLKMRQLAATVRSLVLTADTAGGRRRARFLHAAAKRLRKLNRLITAPKSRVAAGLGQVLGAATAEALSTLQGG
jgi:hypothetical protein